MRSAKTAFLKLWDWSSANLAWLALSVGVFILNAAALRLLGISALGALLAGAIGLVVVIGTTALAGGTQPVMDESWRGKVRLRRWLRGPHPPGLRRSIVAISGILVMAAFLCWLFAEGGERLWPAIGFAGGLVLLLAYVGHKCCGERSARRKLCVGLSAFIGGVLGNYAASASTDGADARALVTALKPIETKIDAVAVALGLINRELDTIGTNVVRGVDIGEENGRKLDAITDKLLALLNQRDATIGQLQRDKDELHGQLRAALERAARGEMASGKTADEAVAAVEQADPARIIDALDREIARNEDELIQKHRERAVFCYAVGEIDKSVYSLNVILAHVPNDAFAMTDLGHLAKLRGDLDEAARLYARAGEFAKDDFARADSYGNLGNVEETRGNLDSAEALHRKSLLINESLGRLDGMSGNYCNLGNIEQTRGNLDAAETWLKKSLAIEEWLGNHVGIARVHCNLGLIEDSRGNLDEAQAHFLKSLAIEEELGRLEGMASDYGNLGLIEETRGNLDAAEAYQKQALAINQKLGRPEGLAADYGNLGMIEYKRGNLDAAETYLKQALALNNKIGRLVGTAISYGNLGLIEHSRGNLDAAETYYNQGLAIDVKLARLEGVANALGNLGLVEWTRCNLDVAQGYFQQSLALHERLGGLRGAAHSYSNLGLIEEERGDFAETRRLWTQSYDLYACIGIPHMVEQMQNRLDALPDE